MALLMEMCDHPQPATSSIEKLRPDASSGLIKLNTHEVEATESLNVDGRVEAELVEADLLDNVARSLGMVSY